MEVTLHHTATPLALADDVAESAPSTETNATPFAHTVVNDVADDYVADEIAANAEKVYLDQRYDALKASARTAASHMLASNRVFYAHLVDLMFFWHSAKETNYITDLIKAKTKSQTYKEKVSHGFNFAPLIAVVWMDIEKPDLPTNKSNRLSRALNRLYEVFDSEFGFDTNSKDALVDYMVDKGGINGLLDYKQKADNESAPDYKADKETVAGASELAKARADTAYRDSLDYFRSQVSLPTVQLPNDITVNEDEVSLVLVAKRSANSFAVIDTVTERDQIATAMTRSYVGQYGQLPRAVRFVAETLATQTCPAEHAATYVHMLNETARSANASAKAAVRRLTYRHKRGDFLLSNIRGLQSGVVTIATPKLPILEDTVDDVAMTPMSRRQVERYLVSPKNFRFVKFNNAIGDATIPADREFTHALKMDVTTGKAEGGAKNVGMVFDREPINKPQEAQVDVIDVGEVNPKWSRTVNVEWFKQFNGAFTNNWVSSHASHIQRQHQAVIEVQFRATALKINFFNMANSRDITTTVKVPSGTVADGYRASFLSKDFAIAMLQIADLPIAGEIKIELFSHFATISYETDVGSYRVHIPIVSSTGERGLDGFTRYTMESIIPEDDVIDSIVGEDSDNDMIEGA
jgi:hypothetical protein